MDKKINKDVLDELNKGCTMGMDALSDIIDKTEDDNFKKILNNEFDKYQKIHKKIEKQYHKYSDDEATETNAFNKVMTKSMLNIKTLTDNSVSKLAEILLQGTNMGIIEGRKLLNHKDNMDEDVKKLVEEFVDMQENSVEELKKHL